MQQQIIIPEILHRSGKSQCKSDCDIDIRYNSDGNIKRLPIPMTMN